MNLLLNYLLPIGGSIVVVGIAVVAVILFRRAARLTASFEGRSRELLTVQRIARVAEQSEDPDKAKANELRQQTSLMREYHDQGLDQCRLSFLFSLSFAAIGFCIIIAAFVAMYIQEAERSKGLTGELNKQSIDIDKELESYHEKAKLLYQEVIASKTELANVESELLQLVQDMGSAESTNKFLTAQYAEAVDSLERVKLEHAERTASELTPQAVLDTDFVQNAQIAIVELEKSGMDPAQFEFKLGELRSINANRINAVQRIVAECDSLSKSSTHSEFSDQSLDGELLELKTSLESLIGTPEVVAADTALASASIPINAGSKEDLSSEIRFLERTYLSAGRLLASTYRLRERFNVEATGRFYLEAIRKLNTELETSRLAMAELDSKHSVANGKEVNIADRLKETQLEKQNQEEARQAQWTHEKS